MFSPNPNPTVPIRAQVFTITPEQFDFQRANFVAATSQYVAAMAATMSQFMEATQQTQKMQTNEASAFTTLAQNTATQVSNQWALYDAAEAQANSDSGSGVLGYLLDAINIVIGILEEDPAMVALGIYGIVSQAKNGGDPLEGVFEKVTGSKILGEFLAGVVEAAGCSAFNFLSTGALKVICRDAAKEVMETAAKDGLENALKEAGSDVAKTAGKDLVKQVAEDAEEQAANSSLNETVSTAAARAKKIIADLIRKMISAIRDVLSYLGTTLMMSPFWQDVAAAIPGMSDQGAMWLGMFFSIIGAAGTSLLAEKSLFKEIFQKGLKNKLGDSSMTVLKAMDYLKVAFILARNGIQINQSVVTLQEADEIRKAVAILREVAGSQKTLTMLQGITDMFNDGIQITQSTLKTVSDDYTSFNQSLSALAYMMDINHQRAV